MTPRRRTVGISLAVFAPVALLAIYAGIFPAVLAWRLQAATHGKPFCLLAPLTPPAARYGWTVDLRQNMRRIRDISEVSLMEIVLRRLEGRTAKNRYSQPIHIGLVSEGRAYHWSFMKQGFVANDSYVAFRREFNRAADFPGECAVEP